MGSTDDDEEETHGHRLCRQQRGGDDNYDRRCNEDLKIAYVDGKRSTRDNDEDDDEDDDTTAIVTSSDTTILTR